MFRVSLVFAVCCLLFVWCELFFFLPVARCSLFVVCWLMDVMIRCLFVVGCLLIVVWCCSLFVVFCLLLFVW